jgi:hypothetical protein
MKFLNFFSIFVGNFCLPGSGSTDLIESGSGSETLGGPYFDMKYTLRYTVYILMS